MEKRTDRRVKKTKSQLRIGLARLMQRKNIGEITVTELVDEVEINRSTFYLHYPDIHTLLRETEDDIMEQMRSAIRKHPIGESSTLQFVEDMFRVLDANREIARALTGPHGDMGFIRKIEQFLEENSEEALDLMFPEKKKDMKYFYSFCLSGCLGFVKTWLEDRRDKGPEYAAQLTFEMIRSSMEAFHECFGDCAEGRCTE